MVKMYSTGCPRCNVLGKKLAEKNINHQIINDVDLMQSKGFTELPQLEVDGKIMNFIEAIKWINEQ